MKNLLGTKVIAVLGNVGDTTGAKIVDCILHSHNGNHFTAVSKDRALVCVQPSTDYPGFYECTSAFPMDSVWDDIIAEKLGEGWNSHDRSGLVNRHSDIECELTLENMLAQLA